MSTSVNGRVSASSAIPRTGIPTPGRPRSTSAATNSFPPLPDDYDFASRAFADAIKANDPAHHRAPAPTQTHPTALSPQSSAFSGRRSVAGRVSATSSTSVPPPRAKTPTSTRPPSRSASRQSDVFGKSTPRPFQAGDNVRIESLGYEGCLRYVGEIDGKPGIFAGVELSGGFAGKGKNNGSVNGKVYFTCPNNCGVFIAMSKLSPPTVGPGAVPRPTSVASSYGGRVTPAPSGRITPSNSLFGSRIGTSTSTSSGRITPSSSGRITPSFSAGRITPGVTPSARASKRALPKSTSSKPGPSTSTSTFTAGSRASKYVTMTAKQLSSRDTQPASPTPRTRDVESPARAAPLRQISSPTRPPGSPFGTPKPAGIPRSSTGLPTPSKGRPPMATPRARIPSAVAMPPPASPISVRSNSATDLRFQDLEDAMLSDSPHDRMNSIKSTASISSFGRPESSLSVSSLATEDRSFVDQLQSRIEALEYDNERLRNLGRQTPNADLAEGTDPETLKRDLETLVQERGNITRERDETLARITELEASLQTSSRNVEERQAQLSALKEDSQEAMLKLEAKKAEMEVTISELQERIDREADTLKGLHDTIAERNSTIEHNSASINTQAAEISSLQQKLEELGAELQNEKQDMGAQIDELRLAGQETIALYEERLNTADSENYELRSRISSLETGLRSAQETSHTPRKSLSSATEIDNETLRDQVHHLQSKISTMEDMLEDAHATAQKEESAMREKIQRLKEKDEAMRKELSDGRREVERMAKSEASARNRVEEIEEALRESTVALENARAEVETLRSELANLDGLVANSSGGDLYSRVAEVAQRAVNDKTRYKQEIAELQQQLEEYRNREVPSTQGSPNNVEILMLKEENTLLQQAITKHEEKVATLSQKLGEYSSEIDSLKKKSNREATVTNGVADAPKAPLTPSKYDMSAGREEITGLKHIVQELQKQNSAGAQRIKLLESENQLLSSEAQQLRQEVQILEENLDQSLIQETNNVPSVPPADTPEKGKKQKDQRELERDQLEKHLAETERKSARTIHDLNKEISELEALVESKIYREDELEQEVERLKKELSRHRKTVKNSPEPPARPRSSVASTQAVCEICERPGHDIFNCDVLNKDTPVTLRHGSSRPSSELFCEDCESHGHVAADCPHSLDVF